MRGLIARFIISFLFLFACGSAPAQQIINVKTGVIFLLEGVIFLDGESCKLPPEGYLQMGSGRILNTKQGYAGLLLAPNAYLWLGENASLQIEQNGAIALNQGSAFVEVAEKFKSNSILVGLSANIIKIDEAGLYRFDADTKEIWVFNGTAVENNQAKQIKIKSGQKVRLEGDFSPSKFKNNSPDSFHRWAGEMSFKLFITVRITDWNVLNGWATNSRYRMSFYCGALPEKLDPSTEIKNEFLKSLLPGDSSGVIKTMHPIEAK